MADIEPFQDVDGERMIEEMGPTDRTRPRYRWRIAAIGALLILAGGFAALPTILGWTAARRLLAARAEAILAPGSLEFSGIRLSWSQPTEIVDFVLRDKRGRPLLVAARAEFSWGLWQILFARPNVAMLSFPGGELDVERFADGTIDLHETLKPILRDRPERRIIVKIDHGRLQFRDLAFPEPVVASEADILVDIAADPGPVTWTVALTSASAEGAAGRFNLTGRLERPSDDATGGGDATIALKTSRWPWSLAVSGIDARGDLDAAVDVGRKSGRWAIAGAATINNLAASGPSLGGPDSIRVGAIQAAWDIDGDGGLWTARRLKVSTALGSIAGARSKQPDAQRGEWLDGELSLAVNARFAPRADRLEIVGIALATPYGRLDGSGTIDQPRTAPRLDLKGSLAPDWPAIQSVLARRLEPNARVAGQPRAWRLAGTFASNANDDRLGGLSGDLGIRLDALDVFGMRLGAAAVVLRTDRGQWRIDPIDARLNEGVLHLEPQWVRDRDGSGRLKLGSSSTLENAVVNDEVSHRVLSYAAPVLDGATRVRGRVSVKRVDAEFPLFAANGAAARMEGDVLFDDVRFLPGPLAEALMGLFPKLDQDRPLLVLRDPVSLRIAGGKVYQQGLAVPIGQLGSIALEGSVDFKRNLDLVARFNANPPGPDMPVLATILRTARLELPIRGTMDDPKIDAEAMKARLKSLGPDLLGGSVAAGADGLLRLLQGLSARRQARLANPGPEQPGPLERPAPMGPEERRNLREERRMERLEKKAERRIRRGLPPE